MQDERIRVEVHSLASGSSGNAMLVKAGHDALLIDAGLSARRLSDALRHRGVAPGALRAVLLTHEHDDHVRGAPLLTGRFRAPLVANQATLAAAAQRAPLGDTAELATGCEAAFGAFTVRSFPVPHDAAEPVGYLVTAGATTVCYFTDAGHASETLHEAVRFAHLCVVESNHDVDWLRLGPYPLAMKERIAGDRGHLSNDDAAGLIAARLECGGPASFWLAHLSRVNNSPALALRHVRERVSALTRVPGLIDVALRDRPSLTWRPGASVQLSLL